MAGALRMSSDSPLMYDDVSPLQMMIDSYIPPVDVKSEPYETAHGPYIQIIEEPKQRGFRFRYECEGPSHGGLPGASSERNRRTYPTVKVNNYVGHARVEVQLVTHTEPPRVHAHSLVGRHCTDNGTCTLDIGPNDLTASFSNLGILHVTKKSVVEVLTRRLRDERKRQRVQGHMTESEESSVLKEAQELGKVMDLNIVRLKFTAFLQDSNGGFTRALKPVVSNPIYDSKSPNASNLKISRMDKSCGSVLGGDEIFLLCDKVQKDDIEVRFYEDEDGGWEAFGEFSPTDVHKQYAIVFRTPPYRSAEIQRPVTVFLQLKRKKAGDCSDPKHFTYVPQVHDKEEVLRKKQKPLPHYEPWGGGFGGGAAGGGGGAAGGPAGGGGGFQFQQANGSPPFYSTFNGFGGGGPQMSGHAPVTGRRAALEQRLAQIAAALSSRPSLAALLSYCSTGDARPLLGLQRHLCGVQDQNGDTPLHLSVIHQQGAVAQQLIHTLVTSRQLDVLNTPNHLRQTPLHIAVVTRQARVAEMLLRAGADPSLLDEQGRSAVHLAALGADVATLRVLLAHLGEAHAHLLNAADFHGLRPLHLAVRRDGERCLRLLVEGGAKVNAPEQSGGHTALHLAVRENLFKVACTLITELNADVNVCTFGGNSSLHLAAGLGSPTLCSLLIAAGALENVENDEPLDSSSDEDPEAPPTPGERHSRGHTPLDLATCQKVRNLLKSRRHLSRKVRGSEPAPLPVGGDRSVLDDATLSRLADVLRSKNVSWRKLAEKLGMATLTHLYQNSSAPCHHLLQHYKLGGGPVSGLVEAFESFGLTEGVRLICSADRAEDKLAADAAVDSGFGSQPVDEEPDAANQG
ncbi:nuclear factor NF-kappa-B p100 subunit [Synchiropus splendidus]|uniref:nuclear factor NF-kappa-B p100 subunit n=1 Tax=Synchiropus splendidus TaxID=270530 RepID=UPI00237D3F7C|nr:nuclear factor NF-kappa-B p100 subunit [Synchiropus splendidus]